MTPDLTCLGKIVGGGLPVGAYGGRRDLMEQIAPLGPVYQAGTLSGNPLAMAAGVATLRLLREDGVYERLEQLAQRLVTGLAEAAAEADVPYTANRVGSMFTGFFTSAAVTDYASARHADTRAYAPLLPRHARAGRLPRALAVRGRLRLAGPHRRRHRGDAEGRGRGLQCRGFRVRGSGFGVSPRLAGVSGGATLNPGP